MSFVLTDATPADAPVLAQILYGWITEAPWMPDLHGPAAAVGFVTGLISSQTVRVARSGDVPQGFLARDGAEVAALYVARPARGRGIGTALIEEAKASGALRLWTFQANLAARTFYGHAGFVVDHLTDGAGNAERLPDLRLVWPAPERLRP